MKIEITAVQHLGGRLRVAFEAALGRGEADWRGPVPEVGERRFVELELAGARVVHRDIEEASAELGIFLDSGATTIVGDVVGVEPSGVVVLSVGDGSLTLEVLGELPCVGRRYRIRCGDLQLFDCEY